MLVIRYFVLIVLFALGSLSSSHAFDLKKLEGELGNALKEIEQNPPTHVSAGMVGDNIYEWEATIIGPSKSPYVGGVFKLADSLVKCEFMNVYLS